MDLAQLCLVALVAVLALSCVTSVNVGLGALGVAWVIGVYVAPHFDRSIGAAGVVGAFPTDLFLTLTGTTLLFAVAQADGTLAWIVERGLRLCGERRALVAPAFFLLSMAIAAVGAGNIAATALIAPSAMAAAGRTGISPLVMALVVAHGSVAGALTPISPIGVITFGKLGEMGLADAAWRACGYNMAAGVIAAVCGVLLFGRRPAAHPLAASSSDASPPPTHQPLQRRQALTLVVIAAVFAGVIFANLHLGLSAITGVFALLLARAADEKTVFRLAPWPVVLMVCGVSVLVKLCETCGGLELLAKLLAQVADADTIDAWLALVAGGVSIFSSTSGVVLPTFLPMVSDVAGEVAGADPRNLATAVVLGANLVDVSPLSTIGALCVAAAPASCDTRRLFNQMLAWGFAMAPVAALMAYALLR